MREIKYIVIHATATPQTTKPTSIIQFWREKLQWKSPGYHFLISADGSFQNLQSISKPANGVAGYNQQSIHVAYIGGITATNKAIDNRTPAQIHTMYKIIATLKEQFPAAKIQGHCDFPNVAKACPCFVVADWLKCTGL